MMASFRKKRLNAYQKTVGQITKRFPLLRLSISCPKCLPPRWCVKRNFGMFLDADNVILPLHTPPGCSIQFSLSALSIAARYQVHGDQALSQCQTGVPSLFIKGLLTGGERSH